MRCLHFVQDHWRVVNGVYIIGCITWSKRAWVCHVACMGMLPLELTHAWTDTMQRMLLFRFASCTAPLRWQPVERAARMMPLLHL